MRRKMKRFFAFLMVIMLLGCMTGCGNNDIIIDVVTNEKTGSQNSTANKETENAGKTDTAEKAESSVTNRAGLKSIPLEELKIGVLYIGSASETSGYTYAHELGIQGMITNLGLSSNQVVRKESIADNDEAIIRAALEECIAEGCNVIFTTSWGYMELTAEFAEQYPDIYFAHGTGYMSNGKNFTNYFGRIYQARYISGIVAGLKTQSGKIGYVSAMGSDNSECTGGINAFALGVERVNPEAEVEVAVTNSWFDPIAEEAAATALVNAGCDILAQHCDTTAPQVVSQENGTWAIGYNSDMSKETPDTTLTSVIWNWSAFYTSYVSSIIDGTYDGTNYFGGMSDSLVSITALADFCGEGTAEIVAEAQQEILSGEHDVFTGELVTNDGTVIGEEGKTLSDDTISGGINWYYRNVRVIDWK